MREGYAVRQLAKQSGHSPGKIRQIIECWLVKEPPTTRSGHSCIILDGSFLEHRTCSLFAVMGGDGHIIAGRYQVPEKVQHLMVYFAELQRGGLHPQSATIDGNPAIARALQAVWPHLVLQCCLVHVQRQGLMWCRRTPKRTDAKQLRKLFLGVTRITTVAERNVFLAQVATWEHRWGQQIAQRRETGWVFSDLVRARSMLLQALPNMFHYLTDLQIPRTTNRLEGYFSRLKTHYRQHRGLSRKKRMRYFAWYFFLVRH